MSQWSESKLPPMGELSSLMDGELDASAVSRACGQWRDDPEVRARWHTYHVIGDVLRSYELASDGGHDAAFLAAFRQRLAQEPVVLAPAALGASPHGLVLRGILHRTQTAGMARRTRRGHHRLRRTRASSSQEIEAGSSMIGRPPTRFRPDAAYFVRATSFLR
jgi:hypothetical protein